MDIIKRILTKLWPEGIGPYAFTAVVLVVTAIWTGLKGWFASPYAPLTIPMLLLIAGLTFYVANQVRSYRRGRHINYQDLVMKWLFKYNFAVQNDPADNALWQIQVISGEKEVPLKIAVLKHEPGFLTMGVATNLDPTEQKELEKITVKSNSTLIEELRIEMSRLGIEYQHISHPISKIYLAEKVALDNNLTELIFIQRFLRIRHAWVIYSATIAKYKKLEHNS